MHYHDVHKLKPNDKVTLCNLPDSSHLNGLSGKVVGVYGDGVLIEIENCEQKLNNGFPVIGLPPACINLI